MRPLVAVAVLTIILTSCGRVRHENSSHVALPSAKLIGCSSSGCSQLWQDKPEDANAIYPKQVSIDIQNSCVSGLVARYDRNISIQEIKAAIDERYGKWALGKNEDPSVPVKLWRVEPEKFAIQLAAVDAQTETMTLGQALAQPIGAQGRRNPSDEVAKQIVYLSFGGKCGAP